MSASRCAPRLCSLLGWRLALRASRSLSLASSGCRSPLAILARAPLPKVNFRRFDSVIAYARVAWEGAGGAAGGHSPDRGGRQPLAGRRLLAPAPTDRATNATGRSPWQSGRCWRRLVAQLKAQLIVKTVRSLHVDLPPFAAKKNVDATMAIADARLADLTNAGFDAGLLAAAGFVVLGRGVHLQYPASPADRHTPVTANPVHQLAFASRPHSFRRMTSCSISLSSERSATRLRSFEFSSSSCFNRRMSAGSMPSYIFFQWKWSPG